MLLIVFTRTLDLYNPWQDHHLEYNYVQKLHSNSSMQKLTLLTSLDYDLSISSGTVWDKNSNNLVPWIYNKPWVGSVCYDTPSSTSLCFAIRYCRTSVVDPVQSKILIPIVGDLQVDSWWSWSRFESRTVGNCNCNWERE